jgi:hypothetical protein
MGKPFQNRSKVDWSKVNWDRDNLSIGMSLGLHKATVRAARKRLGKPEPARPKWTPFVKYSSHIEAMD